MKADDGERMEFVGMSVLFIYTRSTRRENKDDVTIFLLLALKPFLSAITELYYSIT